MTAAEFPRTVQMFQHEANKLLSKQYLILVHVGDVFRDIFHHAFNTYFVTYFVINIIS